MIQFQLFVYKTLIHLTWVKKIMTLTFLTSYLRILHYDCQLIVLNKLINYLEQSWCGSAIWTDSETRILLLLSFKYFNLKAIFSFWWLLYEMTFSLDIAAVSTSSWLDSQFLFLDSYCLCQNVVAFISSREK